MLKSALLTCCLLLLIPSAAFPELTAADLFPAPIALEEPFGNRISSVSLADMNSDGIIDCIADNDQLNAVGLFLGNGDGTFQNDTPLGTIDGPTITGHFNNDQNIDIAVLDGFSIKIMFGNGDGTVGSPQSYNTGSSPSLPIATDINGDNKQDIAVLNTGDADILILIGDGVGNFTAVANNPVTTANPRQIISLHLNDDNHMDLAVASEDAVDLFFGLGGGVFSTKISLTTTIDPERLTSGDFNGDGDIDLAVIGDTFSDDVLVFHNTGTGTFLMPLTLGGSVDPRDVLALDTDNDGREEVVCSMYNGDLAIYDGNSDGSFKEPRYFRTNHPGNAYLHPGDLDENGIQDVVVFTSTDTVITTLLGQSGNTFLAPRGYSIGNSARAFDVEVADFNRDGWLDIVTSNTASDDISLFLALGNGEFTPAPITVDHTNGINPSLQHISVADLNRDKNPDIVAIDAVNDVNLLFGNGNGSFGEPVQFDAGFSPLDVSIADFNGDNWLDLAVLNSGGEDISLFLGTGNGNFGASGTINVGNTPTCIAAGYLDSDSIVDIIVVNSADDDVRPLYGTGTGTFIAGSDIPTGNEPTFAVISDLNGDGQNDILVANAVSDTISMSPNLGNRVFGSATNYDTGSAPFGIAASSSEPYEGKQLAATSSTGAGAVYIYLGEYGALPPSHVIIPIGDSPADVIFADLNNDNNDDVVATNSIIQGFCDVVVLINQNLPRRFRKPRVPYEILLK